MSREQPTLEAEVKALEDEVQALKSAQPFFSGQFRPYSGTSASAYDFEFVTNKANPQYDMFFTLVAPTQDNPILEVYPEFKLLDGTVLDIRNAEYITYQHIGYGTSTAVEVNAGTSGLPIGTTVRVKFSVITSAPGTVFRSGNLRP